MYSLIPGTNQLINKHPQQGAQLFNKWGYNIPHPRFRDYYNGMRKHGLGFFHDLGTLLGQVAPLFLGGGAGAAATMLAKRSATISPLGNETAKSVSGLGSLSSSPIGTIAPYAIPGADEFTGDVSNWTGPDAAQHLHAYNELLNHLEFEARRERNLGLRRPYFAGVEYVSPIMLLSNGDGQQAYQDHSAPQPQQDTPPSTIFGINKKILIAGVIIVAVWLYLKHRK